MKKVQFRFVCAQALLSAVAVSTLVLSGCQSMPFVKKQPVVEPLYVPELVLGSPQVMTILPKRVSCNSTLPMQCVIAKTQDERMLQIPFDWIEGFSPRQGVTYQVSVRPYIDEKLQKTTGKWQLQSILTQY